MCPIEIIEKGLGLYLDPRRVEVRILLLYIVATDSKGASCPMWSSAEARTTQVLEADCLLRHAGVDRLVWVIPMSLSREAT